MRPEDMTRPPFALATAVIRCVVVVSLVVPVAHADGKVFSELVAAPVELPDQRALIHYRAGVETLVIETSFVGGGSELAWIVPLPSLPTAITAATPGLFPTLLQLCRPRLVTMVGLWLAFWLEIGVLLTAYVYRYQKHAAGFAGLGCLGLLVASLLLPTLGGRQEEPPAPITVHRQQTVGAFETTTLGARDPGALVDWLTEHGYAFPDGLREAVAPLVAEGWCFVAARLRTDRPGAGGKTHPLAFTFPTARPIYPMRLTGLAANRPLTVHLFVFADERAEAPGFDVARCARTSGQAGSSVPLLHDCLRILADGATVATHLVAELAPDQMQRDVHLELTPFRSHLPIVFARRQLLHLSVVLGLGVGVLCTLRWLWTGWRRRRWPQREVSAERRRQARLGAALAITALVAPTLLLPGTRANVTHDPPGGMGYLLASDVLDAIADHGPVDLPDARQLTAAAASSLANPLTGEAMKHEDSPGNYTLRGSDDLIEILFYRQDGSSEAYPVAAEAQLKK